MPVTLSLGNFASTQTSSPEPVTKPVAGNDTIDLAANEFVQSISIVGTAGDPYSIGTTNGGSEIVSDVIGDEGWSVEVMNALYPSATTLHFTGTFTVTIRQ